MILYKIKSITKMKLFKKIKSFLTKSDDLLLINPAFEDSTSKINDLYSNRGENPYNTHKRFLKNQITPTNRHAYLNQKF